MPHRNRLATNPLWLVLTFAAGVLVGRYSLSPEALPTISPSPPASRSEGPSRDDAPDPGHPSRSDQATIRATVEYVFDGDSLEVLTNGRRQRVRMIGIDAPERNQPFANQARDYLRSLCESREVRLVDHGRDKYERLLVEVMVDDVNLNQQMVRNGYAWSYDRQDGAMLALQQEARAARRGLWSDPHPIRPAEWRGKNERSEQK